MNTAMEVERAYLAYFGRPADPGGLNYWMTQDAATMRAGFAGSAEYAALYSGMTNDQRIEQVYQNLFGRAAEPAGKAYWVNALNNGTETISSIVTAMQAGAQGSDAVTIANRATYAILFTVGLDTPSEIVGYRGYAAASAGRAAVSAISYTETSLATARSNLTSDIAACITGVAPAVAAATAAAAAATAATVAAAASGVTVATYIANEATYALADTVNILDTGANIGAITAANFTAYTKADTYDASDNVLSLNLAQFVAVTSAKLTAGDTVTVADTGANIGAITAANFTAYANADAYDASDNVLSLNAAQFTAVTSAKLTLGDTVTISDTGANVAGLTFTANVDKYSSTETTFGVGAANTSGDIDVSGTVGDAAGEWVNAAGTLTFWDGAATRTVTLTGITTVSAAGGDAILSFAP